MPTVNSSATAYASGSDVLKYIDRRVLGDFLQDDGVRVEAVDLATDTNLAELLLAASGELESRAFKGERYSTTDLAALTGAGLSLLKQIVIYYAVGFAMWRRNMSAPKNQLLLWAEERMDRLASGEAIFGLLGPAQAGHEENVDPVAGSTEDLNSIVNQASRFFGSRGTSSVTGF